MRLQTHVTASLLLGDGRKSVTKMTAVCVLLLLDNSRPAALLAKQIPHKTLQLGLPFQRDNNWEAETRQPLSVNPPHQAHKETESKLIRLIDGCRSVFHHNTHSPCCTMPWQKRREKEKTFAPEV